MIALTDNYEEAVNVFKNWGIRRETIGIDDIVHILKGGSLVISDGEYSTIITLRDEEEF